MRDTPLLFYASLQIVSSMSQVGKFVFMTIITGNTELGISVMLEWEGYFYICRKNPQKRYDWFQD